MGLIKNSIFYLIGFFPRVFLKNQTNHSNKYIFVHLSRPLGDFVSRLNFLASINHDESKHEIYLVVDKRFKDLIHLINDKIKVELIDSFRYKINPFYRYKILKQLNLNNFSLVVNLSVDRGMFSDEIALYCGAQNKVSIQRKSDFLSSYHSIKNNKKYSTILNFTTQNEYDKLTELTKYLSDDYGIKFYRQNVIRKRKPEEDFIVVAPFSSQKIQSWSIANYLELIERLKELKKIIILGIPTREDNWVTNYTSPNVTNLISKTSLGEADRLIKSALLFIGNDSGLTHLAYHHKIPLIGIIGGGNFEQFFPHGDKTTNEFYYHFLECFNCKWNCKYNEALCLTNVTVDSVFNSAQNMLRR